MMMENEKIDGLEDFTEAGDVTTETAEEQTSAETPEAETTTTPAEEPKGQWDHERQRADQAEANFRRLQVERESLAAEKAAANQRAEQLQAKLDEYAKANDVDLDKIDVEYIDPSVLKVLKSNKAQLDAANARVEKLERIANDFARAEQDKAAAARHEQTKKEIIADIESEFSPQYRNAALKMADDICNKRGFAPPDAYAASKLLRDCYRTLSKQQKTPGKTPIPSDTGRTTTVTKPKEDNIKSGTLREVAAQYRSRAGL